MWLGWHPPSFNHLSLIMYLTHLPHFLFQNFQTYLLFLLVHQLLIDASFLFHIVDFSSLLPLTCISAWALHIWHHFLIDAFITYSGLMTLKWEWYYIPYFVSVLHAYLLVSFLLCVLPAHSSVVYWTTSDLPAILILSSYVPLCHVTHSFLFCTDFLMCTFHSILLLLMTPLPCTTYASLSCLHVSDTLHTDMLPYCAPMCSFLEHLHVYLTYDVSLYLTCISSTLIKAKLLQTWSPLWIQDHKPSLELRLPLLLSSLLLSSLS